MGDSSDSEVFYDAEEECGNNNKIDIDSISVQATTSREVPKSTNKHENVQSDEVVIAEQIVQERRKFNELRKIMQNEDDEGAFITNSGHDSPSSSVDGVYAAATKNKHPFKIIEHDRLSLQSMASLGRVGRILSGISDPSPSNSKESTLEQQILIKEATEDELLHDNLPILPMQEPDVIASTKANSLKYSRNIESVQAITTMTKMEDKPIMTHPVAPPRRKKRGKLKSDATFGDGDDISIATTVSSIYIPPKRPAQLSNLNMDSCNQSIRGSQPLQSPASTIESITRDLQSSFSVTDTFSVKNSAANLSENADSNKNTRNTKTETVCKSADALSSNTSFLDMRSAIKGGYVIKPNEDSALRTHSEERTMPVGHSSLDNDRRARKGDSGRRRSAGDGEGLSDYQVLEQVTVLNLDTGERVPLSIAETKLPQGINPLCLHIMRLTSQYSQPGVERQERETDEESIASEVPPTAADLPSRNRRIRLKNFIGSTVKKTVDAAKSLAAEVTHARHKEDVGDIVDEVRGELTIKLKASHSHKGPYEFEGTVRHVQEMSDHHTGAIWCMKFSMCGQLLATAGQDKTIRIWVLRDAADYFQDMRTKYSAQQKSSPTPSTESLGSLGSLNSPKAAVHCEPPHPAAPFSPKPLCLYHGHTSDVLDVSWSKNCFLLSSSMDKTVRLWHISRNECLCCFQHIDFVTAIAFHPRDDRYFLSGSLDGKLRLWNIPDKKVAVWNEVADGPSKLITAANFCQNGKMAVVGTYDGRCILYTSDQLKFRTSIDVRSARGKNSTGRKITGIEPMPNDDKILVTSNDSRIRLYDLRDLSLSCKYKGYVNTSSQIRASFSHDCKYIVSGSENNCIHIWRTFYDYSKFTSVRRDRNDFWEGIKAHNAVVTCAVFAPNPEHILRVVLDREENEKNRESGHNEQLNTSSMERTHCAGYVLVSADYNGCIKVFLSKSKPKHSSLPASALN